MGNKFCSVLTVVFLCTTIMLLEAVVKKWGFFYNDRMSWKEARLYCQTAHVDLIPLELLYAMRASRPNLGHKVWTGAVRQPEGARVWTEVSFKTGGLSDNDLSRRIKWDDRETDPLCGFVLKSDQMWYSGLCSNEKPYYCLFEDEIHYFKTAKNWYKASDDCQVSTGQLVNMPHFNARNLMKTGWIGAYENNTIWSWVGNYTVFTNWAPNEPQSLDCASYNTSSKKFHRVFCWQKHFPLCQDDNLVVINENKTWEEALDHCLELKHTYNLLSLDESSDYKYIRDRIYRATTTEVWVGLRFLGGLWLWADGHALEETWNLPTCPSERNHCGTLSKYGKKKWIIRDCSEKRNFICYTI